MSNSRRAEPLLLKFSTSNKDDFAICCSPQDHDPPDVKYESHNIHDDTAAARSTQLRSLSAVFFMAAGDELLCTIRTAESVWSLINYYEAVTAVARVAGLCREDRSACRQIEKKR
jgi:hypothetical protein